MNPFDWQGPQFLAFYFMLAVAIIVWCWWRVRGPRDDTLPRYTDLGSDPYRIACLRGGQAEVVRIAVFNLLDRGLLAFGNGRLVVSQPGAKAQLRRPLDQALFDACARSSNLVQLAADRKLRQICAEYAADLEQRGFLPDAPRRAGRRLTCMIALVALSSAAILKIELAFRRGHSNVLFLFLLCVAACIVVLAVCGRRRTPLGDRALSGLRTMTARLRSRAAQLTPGGSTADALLLAGVFGLAALPAASFPMVSQVFPQTRSGGPNSGSSCGSSCSSCGGGCGGCGS